ncbi:ubiquitin-protein ligase (E3) [Coemansia aciculifera]|uniref:Ubiquitin-protein ligase (E3) n=1 Tax=Coemansia aciculifera TaxID=417176 RepID=A0ACC1M3U0_9FUNG|nr:ubiquitin-protein ligase (E3) [Coemansia aciculifera]
MFSFQGDYRRQRNINLGGSRRNDTSRSNAHTVLSKAHEDREKRELERRRQKAVSAMQRYWRGRRDTAKWRQYMRAHFDPSVLSQHPISLPAVYQALTLFSAYYDACSADVETMRSVLLLLFGNSVVGQSVLALVRENSSGSEDDDEWVVLVARLLGQAVRSMAALRADTDLVLSSVACATTASASDGAAVSWSFGWLVLRRMVAAKDLYKFLALCISESDHKLSNRRTAVALDLAMRPLDFAPTRELAMPFFTRQILSIPGLPNKIDVHGVTALTRIGAKWTQLFGCIRSEMISRQRTHMPPSVDLSLAAVNTIGNVTAFVLPRLSRSGPLTSFDIAFVAACSACASAVPSCDLFAGKRSLAGNGLASRLVRAVDPLALKWLNNAMSAQILDLLVRASCEGDDVAAKSAQTLLLTFIQRWGQTVGRAALDSIFQSVDIRAVRWHNVLHDKIFLERFAGPRTKIEYIKTHDLSNFQLLCEVLNRQLQAIGDDELFEKSMSLSVDEIKVVARASRNIAFSLYWAQEESEDLVRVRDAAAALTRQLFIRNARHPFVDEEFWLVQPALLDMASFADKVAEDPVFAADTNETAEDASSLSDSSESDSDMDVEDEDNATPARNSRFSWLTAAYSGLARSPLSRVDKSITTPRVAVLRNIPFVVPFSDRVRLFHALIKRDRTRLAGGQAVDLFSSMMPNQGPTARARVRRGSIFDDGFRALFPVLSGRSVKLPDSAKDEAASLHLARPEHRARPQRRQVLDIDEFGQLVYASDGEDEEDDDDDEFGGDAGRRSRDPSFWGQMNLEQLGMQRGSMDSTRAIASLSSRTSMFKRRMQIQFVDTYGMVEAGIDGGGVFKEFLTCLVHEAFDPRAGMFSSTDHNHLYPSPDALHGDASNRLLTLDKFKFLGAVIGKALYEGVLVDAPFAQFFLGRFLGQLPGFNDLPTLDEDFYRGLVSLKNYPLSDHAGTTATAGASSADDSGDDEDDEIYQVFGLDFTVTVSTLDDTKTAVPLVTGGDKIKVTSRNRLLYLDLIAQFKLVKQISEPVNSFLSGLHTIIPPVWLSLLFASPLELSRLLCGDSGTIDVANWKQHTHYDGAYRAKTSEHPTIVAFWNVVENELSEKQRRDLCRFATSCERPPLLGFAELNPRFCITSSSSDQNGEHDYRLPSASTCVNLLKLPVYSSERILRAKLIAAIESGAGFDLS